MGEQGPREPAAKGMSSSPATLTGGGPPELSGERPKPATVSPGRSPAGPREADLLLQCFRRRSPDQYTRKVGQGPFVQRVTTPLWVAVAGILASTRYAPWLFGVNFRP
jgi:hypothetical protein